MRYPEYRIDFNGKRAILRSQDRSVRCVDLSTGEESRFSPSEQIILSCYFMTMEYYEIHGRDVCDQILLIDPPEITPEEAEVCIGQLQRLYHLKPLTLERRAGKWMATQFLENQIYLN